MNISPRLDNIKKSFKELSVEYKILNLKNMKPLYLHFTSELHANIGIDLRRGKVLFKFDDNDPFSYLIFTNDEYYVDDFIRMYRELVQIYVQSIHDEYLNK